jgi:hypothetical protein
MKFSIESLESRSMMSATVLDVETRALYEKAYADKQITRLEMVAILRSTTDGGTVSPTESADIGRIIPYSNMASDVRILTGSVMAAKPTAATMNTLVDKWFYGKDLPSLNGYPGVAYRRVSGSLFVDGASSSDIKQGRVGDCYFLAAMGALADKNGTAVQTMFKDNMDGTWGVRFYRLDKTRYIEDWVTVDRQLPMNSLGQSVFQSFGTQATNTRNELWPALAEKAYAQWARGNSYANLNGGWSHAVFGEITGSRAQSGFDMASAQAQLIEAVTSNKPVVIYRYMNAAKTVGHAYFVQSYSDGRFRLVNPYGSGHLTLSMGEVTQQCYGFAVASRRS